MLLQSFVFPRKEDTERTEKERERGERETDRQKKKRGEKVNMKIALKKTKRELRKQQQGFLHISAYSMH